MRLRASARASPSRRSSSECRRPSAALSALPRLAGRRRALELLLVGEEFPAGRALELGLVNRVVPHEMLLSAARDLARQIMRHSPLATGAILTAVTRGLNMSIAEGLLAESEQFARIVPMRDLREGLDAWIERRAAYAGV